MKSLHFITVAMLIFFPQFLAAYWNQIGTNSQVTPPLPTTTIAIENAETQTSKAAQYALEKSFLGNLRTDLELSEDITDWIKALNDALTRINPLETPIAEDYIKQALDDPSNALNIIDQGLADLDDWYKNLPGIS